ncbi:hypothetical protein [Lacipirellula sp.]|uniref:hypothetical protein n=1 Tax=Lacipirellula sp. TaxID=2691419 RepID=UPI003D10D88B
MRQLKYCIARNGAQTAVGILVKESATTVRFRMLDDRLIGEPRGHVELRQGTFADVQMAALTHQTASTDNFKSPHPPLRRFQLGDPKQRPRC